MLSPPVKSGAVPFSRSLREDGAFRPLPHFSRVLCQRSRVTTRQIRFWVPHSFAFCAKGWEAALECLGPTMLNSNGKCGDRQMRGQTANARQMRGHGKCGDRRN
jgi:hypothetical protein